MSRTLASLSLDVPRHDWHDPRFVAGISDSVVDELGT